MNDGPLEILKTAIADYPSGRDKNAALHFLGATNIRLLTPRWNTAHPAAHWLRIYSIKFSNPKSVPLCGAASFLERLAEMLSDAPIRMVSFEANEGVGFFWLDKVDHLIGFAVGIKQNPTWSTVRYQPI
jgi:hypothetical protein